MPASAPRMGLAPELYCRIVGVDETGRSLTPQHRSCAFYTYLDAQKSLKSRYIFCKKACTTYQRAHIVGPLSQWRGGVGGRICIADRSCSSSLEKKQPSSAHGCCGCADRGSEVAVPAASTGCVGSMAGAVALGVALTGSPVDAAARLLRGSNNQ